MLDSGNRNPESMIDGNIVDNTAFIIATCWVAEVAEINSPNERHVKRYTTLKPASARSDP